VSDTSNKAPATGTTPGDAPPTLDQRLALVRAFQAQAMRRQDPRAANLGIISADLMGFAHGLAATVQANLAQRPASAEGRQRFIQDAEVYLKVVRQVNRLAQIERQLCPPTKGDEKGR
jgi:hypothetical protein